MESGLIDTFDAVDLRAVAVNDIGDGASAARRRSRHAGDALGNLLELADVHDGQTGVLQAQHQIGIFRIHGNAALRNQYIDIASGRRNAGDPIGDDGQARAEQRRAFYKLWACDPTGLSPHFPLVNHSSHTGPQAP